MKRIRIAGLCLVAMLALSVVTAASASAAEPALYECAKAAKVGKTYTGKYNDKKCSEVNAKGEGKYELKEGIGKGKAFKGKGGGANLQVVGLGGVTCTKSADSGKFTTPKTAGGIKVIFTGCEVEGKVCASAGAKAGEIKTNALKGEVGYVNAAKHEVGADLSPEAGLYLAEFECAPLAFRVSGSVIGLIETKLNTFTKEVTFVFTQTAGKQGIQSFEGGPTDTLVSEINSAGEWGAPVASGEETAVTNKGEELELKA